MKIEIKEFNKFGRSTAFRVDGIEFSTSCWGYGLYHFGQEIIPPEFFSLNQDTKSGRWKAIKREFTEYGDYIKSYIENMEKERNNE